jgi:hypothetical protein
MNDPSLDDMADDFDDTIDERHDMIDDDMMAEPEPEPEPTLARATPGYGAVAVRARPGRLSSPSVSQRKSVLYLRFNAQ